MTALVYIDPPWGSHPVVRLDNAVAELRDNRNRWCLLRRRTSPSMARSVGRRIHELAEQGERWEVEVVDVGFVLDRRHMPVFDVYVRLDAPAPTPEQIKAAESYLLGSAVAS